MKHNLGDEESRKQKQLERFGGKIPRCVGCGKESWVCIEEHHIAGCAFDESTVPVCANCHRELSDKQKDHPPKVGNGDLDEQIGRFLLGLADLFLLLIDKFREWGNALIERSRTAGDHS